MLSSTSSRKEAYDYLVGSVLEVLEIDAVQSRLGTDAATTGELLQNAFLVPRKIGALVLPDEQWVGNNVGIHPILPSDVTLPSPYHYLSIGAIRNESELQPTGKSRFNPATWIYPLAWAGIIGGASLVKPRKHTIGADERIRDLVITGRSLHYNSRQSRALRAAIIVHEFDHVLKRREATAYDYSNQELDSDTFAVIMERSGYDKTASVLEETGVAPNDISVQTVLKKIDAEKPRIAARKLSKFAKQYLGNYTDKCSRTDSAFALRSYGAAALTKLFQNEDGSVSAEEVTAYKSAHYI